ncbi:ImmA/IrrE family metallo-endopeptidase [Herbaspirillum huttiense]|uniref:ImmA/IrrE family metallo-endopeptidase n=2 Tax=Herbaspirillum huttiense TaxID=863372 RepID=A0AAJ2H6B9_9BURK|nr:ImmA/IrrE family metallo-endopeptidase [Herbaspirillum huttiense]MDR9836408.1 ImmA/IrrE family metallo-endopeptidase [Herbaspirillum huttiense]
MSQFENFPQDGSDFSVYPPSATNLLQQILANLEANVEHLKWKEICLRQGGRDAFSIMLETAFELSYMGEQQTLFRKNDSANDALIAIWLANVFRSAKSFLVKSPRREFKSLSLDALPKIAQLSVDINSPRTISAYLWEHFGIALIFEKAFSGMKLDGLVTRMKSGNPLIGMSLRYSRYDYFWFTLMHELSHVALHYELLDSPIVDDTDQYQDSEVEKEANRLASDSMISRRLFNKAEVNRTRSQQDLESLATEASIHPIVAAGLVRHSQRNFEIFSKMVNSVDVRSMLGMT